MLHPRCLSPLERWLQLLLCIERETEARSAAGWVPAPLHPLGRTRPAAPSQNQLGTCGIQFGGGLWDWFLMGRAGSAAAPSATAALAGCVVLKASWGRGDVRKRGHEHLSHVSSACRVARSLWWQQPASGQGLGKPPLSKNHPEGPARGAPALVPSPGRFWSTPGSSCSPLGQYFDSV